MDDSVREPALFRFQRNCLSGSAREFGLDADWRAPLAIYDTPAGFGDEVWLDAQPDTIIAWHIAGGDIRCAFGRRRGEHIGGVNRKVFALQVAGSPNHFSCTGPVKFAQIVIPPALLREALDALGSPEHDVSALSDNLISVEDSVMLDHLAAYAQRALGTPTRLEMEARAMLIVERLLSQHHGFGSRASSQPCMGGTHPSDWRIRRAIDYLDARLGDDVGLADLAAAVKLSPAHLTSLFRAGTGETPHRWFVRRRLKRACELLLDPQKSITTIAHDCGFASSQHFAVSFRKHMGMTATVYRRKRLC